MNSDLRRRARMAALAWLAAGLFASAGVAAHDGEDHSADPGGATQAAAAPAPAPTLAATPRATAQSEAFELVVMLDDGAGTDRPAERAGRSLQLMLDRFATNEPVVGAKVEVEGAGPATLAKETSPGVYQVRLGPSTQAATVTRLPLTISVEAGDSADLLTTTLVIPAPAAGPQAAGHAGEASLSGRLAAAAPWLAALAAVAAVAAAAALLIRRRRRRHEGAT